MNTKWLVPIVAGLVVLAAASGAAWFYLSKGQSIGEAKSMVCSSFALQMAQVHKMREQFSSVFAGKEEDKKEQEDSQQKKFLFNAEADGELEKYTQKLQQMVSGGADTLKSKSEEIQVIFIEMGEMLQAKAPDYFEKCQTQLGPAIEQCAEHQNDQEKLRECLADHRSAISGLMSQYVGMDLPGMPGAPSKDK